MINCSVGVMAHNEERNIGFLLERLLVQQHEQVCVDEIIVVAGGCEDGTERIVKEWSGRDSRIRLVSEPERRGKAAAVNRFIEEAASSLCVVVGADTLPDYDCIDKLVSPLADPRVGMVGSRPVPLNSKKNFPGYVVHFLWDMHHQVASRRPKCGEMVAFRRIFDRLPADTIVDEPQIEALIGEAGLKIVYCPEAIVYNLGPDNLREIIMRRRSIVAGYIRLGARTSYRTSSQSMRWWLIRHVVTRVARREEPLLFAAGAVAVEIISRWLGWWDAAFSSKPLHLWTPAESTKAPADALDYNLDV